VTKLDLTMREKVERSCTIVDLIKHRKLRLFGHICRMTDERLVKTLMVEDDRPRGRLARKMVW